MSESPLVVDMQDIVIRFPGVLANDHVNFQLKRGEIHALLGENGAGKSTLMNALAGLYRPVSGTMIVNGALANFSSPRDAILRGIGMVHQHFMLVPTQSVTENILLGLPRPRFRLNLPVFDREIVELQNRFGLRVDPKAKIWQLSVGEQQRVEILKTLYRGADILIFDEPTAVLAPVEIDELLATMRSMVDQGKSIIFITHKLHEVTAIADRVSVLRKGRLQATIPVAGVSKQELAELMVGRPVLFSVKKEWQEPGDIVLDIKNVSAENDKGLPALRDISLTIHRGEILSIAAIAGNGQSELAEVITGLRPCSGSILINGQEVSNEAPIIAINQGVAHIPEDRNRVGSAPNLTITDNAIMKSYREAPIGNGWRVDSNAARENARDLKKAYDVTAPTVETMVRKLSGGNLQKLILGREISAEPKLIVAVQPTRGLDVGAIEAIQTLLLAQRAAGAAILLISEELNELLALGDRVAVVHHGQIMGTMPCATANINDIGLMMIGAMPERSRNQPTSEEEEAG